MKLLYLDTETTGVNPIDHSLHQVSMIYEDQIGTQEFDFKIKPYKDIFSPALKKGEIYIETLNQYPDQRESFSEFLTTLDSLVDSRDPRDKLFLIGYNISFDEQFIRQWFHDNDNNFYGSYFWNPSIDVMTLAMNRLMFKRSLMPNFKLETVCQMFNIYNTGQQHEGMNDVIMTRKLHKVVL
jgi:DNA polymerase III alpha subunit (gram-positive type)